MSSPLEAALRVGGADLWRPAALARSGGWATAVALLLLLVSHLAVLLVRRRRGRTGRPAETTAAPAPASPASAPGSGTGIERLVTEDDLRQLVSGLAVGAREPEREGWDPVVVKGNDDVSYSAWCDKTRDGPPRYLSITTYERCSAELLRDFYMDNEYRMEWDNTVTKHEQLQYDENSGVEVGRTIKKFPLLTPREYVLAWRVWETNDKSFYCFIKECEHPLVPRQKKFVRVRLLRSGWCIKKIPGRDACQITVLHHEDNGMNIEMAKLAFSKGIWSYICKMNNALRRYPRHGSSSISIQTMQRLMKKFPQDLEASTDAIHPAPEDTTATVVPSTESARGSPCKALATFDAMLPTNVEPNKATVLTVLSACANSGSANFGQRVEEQVIAMGLQSDLQVSTGLINMYCKCGSIQHARQIFDGIANRDLAVWSAMINGYACNGEGRKALNLFNEMQKSDLEPDTIVFTHILTACNHSGLVDEGLHCFHSMTVDHGIRPSTEHYMCMVDLLCKAGHLNSAIQFFKQMPVQMQKQVLAPLINAHSAQCSDSSRDLLQELLNVDSQDCGHYVLMSNMLSCVGKWKKAKIYRTLINKQGLVKEPGWSCIEMGG